MKHKCMFEHCKTQIDMEMAFCKPHYFNLSGELRTKLNKAYSNYKNSTGRKALEHLEDVQEKCNFYLLDLME